MKFSYREIKFSKINIPKSYPDPLAVIRGLLLRKGEGKGREGIEGEGRGNEGKGGTREGREKKGRGGKEVGAPTTCLHDAPARQASSLANVHKTFMNSWMYCSPGVGLRAGYYYTISIRRISHS